QVRNLSFEFDTAFSDTFEIEDIEKDNIGNETVWTIITRQGDMEFISEGYTQYIRQEPSFQFGQTISYAERHGWNLDRTTVQNNPNLTRADVIENLKQDLEHYENAKRRHLKRKEYKELKEARE